ncbi:MAG: hypothetical protein HRU38_26365, partial [Saccharospirillaceae bacterium]|nr:hypothetical protein [Saccharospirillaceae bacterium]
NIFNIELQATSENLRLLQEKKIDLGGLEEQVSRVVAPNLLKYNNSWGDVNTMLDEAMSSKYRNLLKDDFGRGWVYSWHCMDHAGYSDNPRRKDLGYGNIYRFYKQAILETKSHLDEINWHFHPLSFKRNPLQCATSYVNSYDVLMQILCRRLIDEQWLPVANRPGFHTERPDSHAFLEQWIPYDYANQFYEEEDGQPDLVKGRFGDWRRSCSSWRGYRPSHDDYQIPGACRRWIFRCLNVGTRFNELKEVHVNQAFSEANEHGSAILSFANHDYRDIRPDVDYVRDLIKKVRSDYPNVKIKFSGAVEAAKGHINNIMPSSVGKIKILITRDENTIQVKVISGKLFGPQPFLAIKTVSGEYFYDNMDVQVPGESFSYVLDSETFYSHQIEKIGVGVTGIEGSSMSSVLEIKDIECVSFKSKVGT